jgi:hypothetical protein
MEKISESHLLNMVFNDLVNREELLIKKYKLYLGDLKLEKPKNKLLLELLKDYKKECTGHIDILKDKMIKLNLER